MMMMAMMISQTLMSHPLKLVNIILQHCYNNIIIIMIQHCVGIQENTKGSTNGVDHDSGLGTSRYKSTMSCTVSDVRTL